MMGYCPAPGVDYNVSTFCNWSVCAEENTNEFYMYIFTYSGRFVDLHHDLFP